MKSITTVQVEKFSHDGRGIARVNGKTTFIQGALPGETVSFYPIRRKKDYDEGQLAEVIVPSTDRVIPRCPHYELCGGCSLQHLAAEAQIVEKQDWLSDLLQRVGQVQPTYWLPPLVASYWHYRHKARLSVRYVEKKHATLVGFRERHNPRYITEINQCPVLHARVDQAIRPMRDCIDSLQNPKCIAQIEVAAGDNEVALIWRNLSALSNEDETKIKAFAEAHNFIIFLQPAGPDSVRLLYPENGDGWLTYMLPEQDLTFWFHPTDFTQVNNQLNGLMVEQALKLLAIEPEDRVLDLFCGLGNFSLPISKHCACVLGVEGSESMVQRAQMNASNNGITNARFHCANLEEEIAFSLFEQQPFNKVLIDPPRAGAFAMIKQMSKLNPKKIVYVSCNPATLARDADCLVHQQGYKMIAAGVMDMFVHTTHVESIAVFEKG